MLKYARLAILIMLFGCTTIPYTAHKMNMIKLGMSKQQVIEILGEPVSTSAKDNITYIRYFLHDKIEGVPREQEYSYYFVRLVDGKVESFGRTGDFDSAKVPETKRTIDLNIKNKDSK